MWVIDEVVRPDSLPEGWVAYTDQSSKKPFYHNKTLGVSVIFPPGQCYSLAA
jgi:hypothetical protein